MESELATLLQAEEDELSSALRKVGAIAAEEQLHGFRTVENWRPGGAETWIYVFDVLVGGSATRVIIKAFVSLGGGVERLQTMLNRRSLLQSRGVAVPRLYAVGRGVLMEEHVPWLLREYIREARARDDGGVSRPLLVDLYRLATVLDALGFAPLSPFIDLRTDGLRAVAVDFGEDLGGPHMRVRTQPVVSEVAPWLRSLGLHIAQATLEDALCEAQSTQVAASSDC